MNAIEFQAVAHDGILVNLTPKLFESGFDLYRRHTDKQWGLVDCLSFVLMRQMKLTTALAFDQHFPQAGSVVPRL